MKTHRLFPSNPNPYLFYILLSIIAFSSAAWLDFGSGGYEPPVLETIYASPVELTGSIAFSTNNLNLLTAEDHAVANLDDLEDMVTHAYVGDHHLYLEYGVSTTNCTDHDHLEAITIQNGISAVGWEHDVRYPGTIWFQIVSQCEEDFDFNDFGDGAYWKGEQWYPAFQYPTTLHRKRIYG